MRIHVANPRHRDRFLRFMVLYFLREKIINNVAFRQMRCLRCRASEIFNVGTTEGGEQTSWGMRGAVSTPGVYGAAPRSKKYVSKYLHGFFITINNIILYFKHIIHIDDPPSRGSRLVTNICADSDCSTAMHLQPPSHNRHSRSEWASQWKK